MTLNRHDLLERVRQPDPLSGAGSARTLAEAAPPDSFAVALRDRNGTPRIVRREDFAGTVVPEHYTTLQTEVSKG